MDDSAPRPAPARDPAPAPAASQFGHGHGWAWALSALFLAAVAFGAWGLWKVLVPPVAEPGVTAQGQADVGAMQQRIATLAASDRISREANARLQQELADRDEEIAGLRADVAFYERFVGATGQRRGLAVHEVEVQPQPNGAVHFIVTLTQSLRRDAVSSGRATLAVEGLQGGRLKRLGWGELRPAGTPGVPYSFKFFQRIEGDLQLPPGFTPQRVQVRVQPQSGPVLERAFPWADAIAGHPAPDAATSP